jgi:branched-chain amino acid transport system permease protein
MSWLRGVNRTRLWTFLVLVVLYILAFWGLETGDAIVTSIRGLSSAALIFLVAAGLSLIFGLMDVLNLAHGEVFMLGAYVAWTVYVRPDTFLDFVTPLALLLIGFILGPLWVRTITLRRPWAWALVIVGLSLAVVGFSTYPLAIWNPEVYNQSPIIFSVAMDTGTLMSPDPATPGRLAPIIAAAALAIGGVLTAIGAQSLTHRDQPRPTGKVRPRVYLAAAGVAVIGVLVAAVNTPLTDWFFGLGTTVRFFVAILIAVSSGYFVGRLVEVSLIRPLYDRLLYQLMITLGLGLVLLESIRTIWGRSEFNMPRPDIFAGTGEGCPAGNLGDLFQYKCSTIELFGTRIRTYNEIFIPLVGILVLVGVTMLLRRSRIGMTIRAGVQDPEMVEAMGINVRSVFTLVFGLGVALAALGGVLAAPSTALSLDLGGRFLVAALIALAVGGLTSFPGAAVGALVVGLLQQFIIKYGQVGIDLPFMAEPFKPSPPLVPAMTVLLMVVILIILPGGLLGRSHQ